MFRSVYSVSLCCSVYCFCVNVYCTECFITNIPNLKPHISATTNPKLMKLVPCERPWPRVSYDCRQIPQLAPKQTLSLVIEKMASKQHKAFSVLEFSKTSFVIMAFPRRYGIDPPMAKNIRRWYEQFQETGCLCKGRSPGRPRTSEENVHRILEAFQRSPRKSTCRASRELTIPRVKLEDLLNSL
jgi:hypothetical protein